MLQTLQRFLESFLDTVMGQTAMLAVGIALLLAGGHWLVTGSVTIARRLGLSTLFVGLTIVAFGTSAPELVFNVIAASSGHSELSFGNIVGSNIANIGLILGLAALISPLTVHGRVVSKELPWLIAVSVAVAALAWFAPGVGEGEKGFSRVDGAAMLVLFAIFMASWYRMGRRETGDPLVRELGEEAAAETRASLTAAVGLLILGLAGLVGGGKLAETGAVEIATLLGLSQALIGLTIVAFATSLPELATAIIACRRGHHDLAVGNVVGSNFFNLLFVLAVTAIIAPVAMPAKWGPWDLGVMIVITILLLPMAISHRRRITRWDGAILLGVYVSYMAVRVVLRD